MNRLPRNEGVISTETLRATDRIIRPDEERIAYSVCRDFGLGPST